MAEVTVIRRAMPDDMTPRFRTCTSKAEAGFPQLGPPISISKPWRKARPLEGAKLGSLKGRTTLTSFWAAQPARAEVSTA